MANMHEIMGLNQASRDSRGKKKSELHHVEIHPTENGGHIVEHHHSHEGMNYKEPERHVFGKDEHKEMLAHVANALKLPEPKEEEEKQESEHEPEEEEGEGAE